MIKHALLGASATAALSLAALSAAGHVFPVRMDLTPLENLRAQAQELNEESAELVSKADAEERDLTDDEVKTIEANAEKVEKLVRQINAREKIGIANAGTGRKSTPDVQDRNDGGANGGRKVYPQAKDPRRGFNHLGDFAATVRGAASRDEASMTRLMNMNEGVGEDGGFIVPPEFREEIMKVVEGEDSLLAMTDSSTTARNSVTHPKDETTPWGTAGIVAYWEGEAQAAAAAGAKFQGDTLRLNKLFARVDVTDELLEDAPQLDNYLRVKAPEVMTSVINLAIIQGNGVGKPLGIMNSGALVTVAKETSQPADTIFHRNLVNMMGRMYAPCWPRATWLMHQDVWAKLPLMSFADVGKYPSTATGTQVPIYIPPGALSATPYGSLLGRPIMVLQGMETIGDLGDIILADMTKYRTLTKAGGPRVDTSIHLKFDTDETVFRFIFRMAGAPWWSAPISPRDGTNTLSPFVTLATR